MNYAKVKMRWETFTFPIKKGTPVSAAGIEADNATAVGIVPIQIERKPLMDSFNIAIGGEVDIKNIDYVLSSEAKKAMTGITFFDGVNQTPAPEMDPYTLPNATTTKVGGVKKASKVTALGDDAELADVIATVNDIIAKMQTAGQMVS